LDLLYGWLINNEQGDRVQVACASNPALMPAYRPTEKDLDTVGDRPTGFFKAAVRAQITAGMYSPWYLVEHAKQFVKDPESVDELVILINQALDAIQPPIPEEVRPELEECLLKYYGVRTGK
jgi:hypothetical protein